MSRTYPPNLPAAAFVVALASLPGAGPASLRRVLEGRTPLQAWVGVADGTVERPASRSATDGTVERPRLRPAAGDGPGAQLTLGVAGGGGGRHRSPSWSDFAARCDLEELWRATRAQGIGVTWLGDDRYPTRLGDDPDGPPVLFWRGDLDCLMKPTVAVVGTRHCSPLGRAVARELGRDLAEADVCVVSGLALGIDGAAHGGALASSRAAGVTAGIAASGVDVAYPRQHRDLWEQVVTRGVVVAETAPGRPAQAWRFPARNRIIAGLADLVVVVESFEAGGSLLTVDAALARGVDVRAVPGPVHSASSSGTNRLLMDGAAPVRHAGDVLDALGIDRRHSGVASSPDRPVGHGTASLGPLERRVFEAVGWAPTLLGRIVERTGGQVGATVGALARLEEAGLVIAGGAWWVRRPQG